MVSQSKPLLALFLGAGFSTHWGLPLAGKVMDTNDLHSIRFPKKWHYDLMERVEAYWKATAGQHHNVVDNFARLLQHSPSSALSHDQFVQFLALRFSVYHWKVGESQRTKGGTGDHIRKKKYIPPGYERFVQAFRGQRLAGIITTNYDIVIEKLLGPRPRGRLGGFNYGQLEEELTARHYTTSQWSYGGVRVMGKTPLLKIHGSLNWALSPTQQLVKYVDARPSRLQGYRPVLLPPGSTAASDSLAPFWEHAGAVLSKANIWIFCGYSMPPYDTDVASLLRSSASNELKKVVVLAPRRDRSSIIRQITTALSASDKAPVRIQYVPGPQLDDDFDPAQVAPLLELR